MYGKRNENSWKSQRLYYKEMSLVADYGSGSESDDDTDQIAPAVPVKAVPVQKSKPPAPRKIIVAKPASAAAFESNEAKSKDPPKDKSLSIFGKPSIASFLPAPKNRKKPAATGSAGGTGPGSSAPSSGTGSPAVSMVHEVSKQTRTLGGGIKNTFFDGEIATAMPQRAPNSDGGAEPPAKKVKLIPAAVLARQAKAAKLAKLGQPVPSSLKSSIPLVTSQEGPLVGPEKPVSPAQTVLTPTPEPTKAKLNLPSLFGIETAGKAKQGPALPATDAADYKPIMLENEEEETATEDAPGLGDEMYNEQVHDGRHTDEPTAGDASNSLVAEITKHELGNARSRKAAAAAAGAPTVVDFSVADFYATNASLKAQGMLDENKRPVKAIGGGRHQLTTLLRSAQTNQEGLEQMYAENRRTKKEAGSKYGF